MSHRNFWLCLGTITILGGAIGAVLARPQPRLVLPAPTRLPVAPTASATAPEPDPPPKPVERLLGTYTSLFKTEAKDERVWNITLGAKKLDGVVLRPGEEWSFNEAVGPRTKERGFKDAPTLLMGEVIPGLGGGMCQVSSTVHAAALRTGLDIVKRHPHSRPSSYIERGMDATVNYPEHCWEGKQDPNTCFDLVLRNPYAFPIIIRTMVHDPVQPTDVPKKALTVELRGEGPVAQVQLRWKLYSTPPFKKKYRRAWRKGEWAKKQQAGQNGVNGALTVDLVWPDGHKESRVIYSKYPPVTEVWYVGQDWPEDKPPWE